MEIRLFFLFTGRQTDHLTIMSDPENNTVAVASVATDKTNVAATDNIEEPATKTGTKACTLAFSNNSAVLIELWFIYSY